MVLERLSDAQDQALNRLRERWLRYGRAMNLTAAGDEAAIDHHIGEALAAVDAVEQALGRDLEATDRWIDVGSGGGFPGLVVAAVRPMEILLLEPRQRRASFLEVSLGVVGRRPGAPATSTLGRAWCLRGRVLPTGEVQAESGVRPPEDLDLRPGSWTVAGARAVFGPDEWGEVGRMLVSSAGLVTFHLPRGGHMPANWAQLGRSEADLGVVCAGRPRAVDG